MPENAHLQASQFIFKAAGSREFVYGPHLMTSFEYIRRLVNNHERVNLVMSEKAQLLLETDHEEIFEDEWMQGGEEILEACTIQYRHEDVCYDDMAWDEKTHISLWELTETLRVQILGVE